MDNFEYFQDELKYLRSSVDDFGRAYPAVASELKLSAGRSADPHVEQLLQSFAFLTGKLRMDMEQQRDQLSNQMLHGLYPNLMRSSPCMTVLQANVETDGANFVTGSVLEKGRQLFAMASRTGSEAKTECRFQCCYDTELWPFEIDSVKVLPKNYYPFLDRRKDTQAVIAISIDNKGMDPAYQYPIDKLRFYLNDSINRTELYQLLNDKLVGIAIKINDKVVMLKDSELAWLGFAENENVLPDEGSSQRAYRLLQEYFSYVNKFYFCDLTELDLSGAHDHFEILLLLDEPSRAIDVNLQSFSINCFPAINLYTKTFRPIQLDQSKHEYRVIADQSQYLEAEVHSISEVRSISYDGESHQVRPWIGGTAGSGNEQYYITRLVPMLKSAQIGCDTLLSFYQPDFKLSQPIDQTIAAKGWCNNRRLPEYLRIGDKLQLIGAGAMLNASVVEQPSRFKGASLDGENSVKLLSQLTLNLYALGEGEDRLSVLKQLLYLYCDVDTPSHVKQLDGLIGMESKAIVKRMGKDAWRGHCRGSQLTLCIDETCFNGANPLLLGEVLSHFFGLYTSLNHFVQLQLISHQQEGVWKQWRPRIGEQVIL